ncbi:MAG: Demethylmenaquinone methyltransferase [Phycisphaerae bacterium]|nr:Demethylmenaquinone methyltransferase [Phycisphaerae bacterium]
MCAEQTARDGTPAVGWDADALRDPHGREDKARRVERMFDAIAPTYERVNTIASLGRDAAWRRAAVRAADVRRGDVVLDVCCGTGDMLRAFASGATPPERLVGIDFSAQMLARGRYHGLVIPVQLLRADALRLPLRDASVDVASCAFGVRNFQDLDAGLGEMRRVLREGGRLVILEFTVPSNVLLRWPYRFYTELVLPRLANWISRDRTRAYRYLPRSIRKFLPREAMIRRLRAAGLDDVAAESLNLGSVAIYRGVRHESG